MALYQAQVKWFSDVKSDVFLNVVWQYTCKPEIYFVIGHFGPGLGKSDKS